MPPPRCSRAAARGPRSSSAPAASRSPSSSSTSGCAPSSTTFPRAVPATSRATPGSTSTPPSSTPVSPRARPRWSASPSSAPATSPGTPAPSSMSSLASATVDPTTGAYSRLDHGLLDSALASESPALFACLALSLGDVSIAEFAGLGRLEPRAHPYAGAAPPFTVLARGPGPAEAADGDRFRVHIPPGLARRDAPLPLRARRRGRERQVLPLLPARGRRRPAYRRRPDPHRAGRAALRAPPGYGGSRGAGTPRIGLSPRGHRRTGRGHGRGARAGSGLRRTGPGDGAHARRGHRRRAGRHRARPAGGARDALRRPARRV